MDRISTLLNWVNEKNLFTRARKQITKSKSNKRSGHNEPSEKIENIEEKEFEKKNKNIFNKAFEKAKNLKNKSTRCVISSYLATERCKLLNPIQNNYTKNNEHKSWKNRKILLRKGCNNKLKDRPIGQDEPIQDAFDKEEFWSDMGPCGYDVIKSLHELQIEKDKKANEEYEKWKEDNKETYEANNKEDGRRGRSMHSSYARYNRTKKERNNNDTTKTDARMSRIQKYLEKKRQLETKKPQVEHVIQTTLLPRQRRASTEEETKDTTIQSGGYTLNKRKSKRKPQKKSRKKKTRRKSKKKKTRRKSKKKKTRRKSMRKKNRI